jgi:hypothetical protein
VSQGDEILHFSHWSFEEVIGLFFSTTLDAQAVESLSEVVEEQDQQWGDCQEEQQSRRYQQELSYKE